MSNLTVYALELTAPTKLVLAVSSSHNWLEEQCKKVNNAFAPAFSEVLSAPTDLDKDISNRLTSLLIDTKHDPMYFKAEVVPFTAISENDKGFFMPKIMLEKADGRRLALHTLSINEDPLDIMRKISDLSLLELSSTSNLPVRLVDNLKRLVATQEITSIDTHFGKLRNLYSTSVEKGVHIFDKVNPCVQNTYGFDITLVTNSGRIEVDLFNTFSKAVLDFMKVELSKMYVVFDIESQRASLQYEEPTADDLLFTALTEWHTSSDAYTNQAITCINSVLAALPFSDFSKVEKLRQSLIPYSRVNSVYEYTNPTIDSLYNTK